MGRNGFTLGIGPSHESVIEGSFGVSYANVGRHTDEYITILAQLLHGEAVESTARTSTCASVPQPSPDGVTVPVLVAALGAVLVARGWCGGRRHDPVDGQRPRGRRARRTAIRAAADAPAATRRSWPASR